MACFDFDESQDWTVPSDDVDLTVLRPITGSHDAISQRAKVVDGQDLGFATETQSVEQNGKRHKSKRGRAYVRAATTADKVSAAKAA